MNACPMKLRTLGLLLAALSLAACADGKDGTAGEPGTPGPEGEGSARPRIDSLAPSAGSLRNVVLLTGTNFSAVPSENEVRFGGGEATVMEATATALTVLPPFDLAPGYAPVTVMRGDDVSAPVGFTLVPSGTRLPSHAAAPVEPGEAVELPDGRVLVADARLSNILVIEPEGNVREIARGQGLVSPSRMVQGPDGSVIVFDRDAGAVFRLDTGTELVEVEHWGASYFGGSHDAAKNLFVANAASSSVARIAANGTVTPAWCDSPGFFVSDVQVIGTDVYVALFSLASMSIVKCSTTAAGSPVPVVVPGMTSISTLSTAGADLLVTGVFAETNDQWGVVRIAADGTVTPVTTDAAGEGPYGILNGAIQLQGGDFLVSDYLHGFVATVSGTTLDVRAAAIYGVGASVRVAGKTYFSAHRGDLAPGWIAELGDDGRTRILAQGRFQQIVAGADGASIVAVRTDGNRDVVSIDLGTGVATTLFPAVTEIPAPTGLARDGAGNWYVASAASGTIAQYGPTGAVLDASFASVPGVESLHVQDGELIALSPASGRAERIALATGTVSPWVAPGVQIAPWFLLRDSDASMARDLIADRTGNRVVDVDLYGFVADFATGLPGASSIAQREDGMLLVRCSNGVQLLTP